MKKTYIKSLSLLLLLAIVAGLCVIQTCAEEVKTTPTGYKNADDVVYNIYTEGKFKVIANWGARAEEATFLSKYAVEYYTGDASYEKLSANTGGSGKTDAPQSALFKALRELMESRHTYKTNYDETRPLYRYTDCISGNKDRFSSFYSGTLYDGTWIGGSNTPWNREHTWPKSKGIKNSPAADDIMMLRATLRSENGSRGNKAYGESSGYFEPGESTRGDCARILLYMYVRWETFGRMWGSDGVIESLDILLKWMEEDPVDTWEMGRNDSVESITGVRNVFVDYPEFAFSLFGRETPEGYTTPSSLSSVGTDKSTETNAPASTESESDTKTDTPKDISSQTFVFIIILCTVTALAVTVIVVVVVIKKKKCRKA